MLFSWDPLTLKGGIANSLEDRPEIQEDLDRLEHGPVQQNSVQWSEKQGFTHRQKTPNAPVYSRWDLAQQ